jgi:hypothetical protein
MNPTVPKVERCENQRLELRNLAQYERAEHVWPALIVQDINLFRYRKCVIDLDAEVPDSTFVLVGK